MGMTIARLRKELTALIDKGHGRKPVCVNKASFSHPLESDGAVILNAETIDLRWILMADDDGGIKVNKDGSESGKTVLVISGDAEY